MADKPLVVVLGGSGFIGRHLCRRLVEQEFLVRSVSRSGAPKDCSEPWSSLVEWVAATIGSEKCNSALRGARCVLHLASTTVPSTSNSDIEYDLESNSIATVRTLESASKMGVGRVVFVSSGGTVYGVARQIPIAEDHPTEPICSYGIHKLVIEKYLHLFHSQNRLNSIVLRISNVYGESQNCNKPFGAVAHFAARAVEGLPIEIWGDGTIIRDYIHIEDAIESLFQALTYHGTERAFNIGSGRGVSLNQLIEMLQPHVFQPIVVNHQPARSCDVAENVLDISRAQRHLSWTPRLSIEAGLARMVRAAQTKLTGLRI